MYAILFNGGVKPAIISDLGIFLSPEAAHERLTDRVKGSGLPMDKYSVVKLTKLQPVTKTITVFEEIN